jgi:hypothetical protein
VTDDTARPVPNASGTDRDAIPKAITAARAKALATGKTLKEQINTYWSIGPVPPLHCGPVRDFVEQVIKPQNRCIALILENAGVVFSWDDPPTQQSVDYNLSAASRWKAIQRPKPKGAHGQ